MSVTVTTVIKIPEHFRAIKLVSTLTFPIIPYHHLPSWYVRLCKGIMSAIVNIYASKSKHPRMFKTAINHRLNAKKGCTQTVKKGCILFAFLYAYFFQFVCILFWLILGMIIATSRLSIKLPRCFLFQHLSAFCANICQRFISTFLNNFTPTIPNILRYHLLPFMLSFAII